MFCGRQVIRSLSSALSSPPLATTGAGRHHHSSLQQAALLFNCDKARQHHQTRPLATAAAAVAVTTPVADAMATPSSSSPPSDRRPLVISGPSGVGKGTLIKMLFSRHPDTFTLSVSHTTRAPRPGEKDGVDYHYVTKEAFRELIEQDKFVEHAQFGSNLYGTSKATIEEQTAKGKVVVLDIEMEGVKQVKKSSISARYVFVSPPSEEELEKRLRGRGTETEESIQQRLTRAKDELEFARTAEFDLILTNDDLETAYSTLDGFVYSAAPAVAASAS